jgi:RNA polymerase sigma-70 factor, ECF subfamily
MHEPDAAYVARARAGDRDAFRVLVERHARSIYRLAFRMTGNQQDAEDIVQDTLLKAYRQLGRFEDRASFSTWLYRIAANCSLDLLRDRKRRDERTVDASPEEAQLADPVASGDPPADRMVFGAEIRQSVAKAMAQLTHLERTAFVLRHQEGMSIDEIGSVLGLRTSATKHSIFRAVHKLRRALQPVMRPAE